MNTAVIDVPQAKAREEVAAYRRLVRARHVEEDDLILRGYKVIASGKTVISLSETIKQGGFDETTGMPKLGVVKADEKILFCHYDWRQRLTFEWTMRRTRWGSSRVELADTTVISDNGLRVPSILCNRELQRNIYEAQVPIVPPALRPAHMGAYHILFEATWSLTRAPGRDPALIKYIGGDLWALVATWDMTELEQLVLLGRRPR
jgi:hypothetical protein